MEVKLFVHQSAKEAEETVNKWLKQNQVKIEYIGQSQSELSGRFVFIFSVFYSRKNVAQSVQQTNGSACAFSAEIHR